MKVVKIQGPNNASCAVGTLITNDDGTPVHGVRACDISMRIDAPITATLELCVVLTEVLAMPTYVMIDPLTGKKKAIARIEFADGTVFEG